jgi:hypothetical protein
MAKRNTTGFSTSIATASAVAGSKTAPVDDVAAEQGRDHAGPEGHS